MTTEINIPRSEYLIIYKSFTMQNLVFIALGGAFGALGRYWVTNLFFQPQSTLPWGTLLVNVLGSLIMGALFVIIVEKAQLPASFRPLLMIGFLGAFTTFSTFSLETVALIHEGHIMSAAIYILLSVIFSVVALAAGIAITRSFYPF